MAKQKKNTGANLGFEDKLWAAADKLRGNMDAAEYKHVPFEEKMAEATELDATIKANFSRLGFDEGGS